MVRYFYTGDYEWELLPSTSASDIQGSSPVSPNSDKVSPIGDNLTTQSSQPSQQGTTSNIYESDLNFHILMYSFADRMCINGLKLLAREYVRDELEDDFKLIPSAILDIYRSTPPFDRGLRGIVLKAALEEIGCLRAKDSPYGRILQNTLLESVPQFTYDLLIMMIDQVPMHDFS